MKSKLRIWNFVRVIIVMVLLLAGFGVHSAMALASLPEGATITSATLFLYANNTSGATVNVHEITSPWDEVTVTWENFGGSYNPTIESSFVGNAGWVSADVTSIVQSWVNGDPNYGVLIEQGASNFTVYLSKENGDFALGPYLEICYGSPVSCITIQSTAAEPNAVEDAYIWELYPTVHYGRLGTLYTGLVNGYEKQSLLHFDFSLTPPPPGGEGCTPGYWRNHPEDWPPTGFAWSDDFDATFGVDNFNPNITLGEAIWLGGGGVNKLARHGTAALLSAAHPDVNYPYTVAEVIAYVQAGDVDPLVAANELGCNIP